MLVNYTIPALMEKHDNVPAPKLKQPIETVQQAQALLITVVRSSLTSLIAAVDQLKVVHGSRSQVASKVIETRESVIVYPEMLERMKRTLGDMQATKVLLQQQLATQKTGNDNALFYLKLELQEAEATELRAESLLERYAEGQRDAETTLSQLKPKKEFLDTQVHDVGLSVLTRTDALRQDLKKAFAISSLVELLPCGYRKELDDILSPIQPNWDPGCIVEQLKTFRQTLRKDLTPKPPPTKPTKRKLHLRRQSREKKESLPTNVRIMIRRDLPEVLEMEQLSCKHAWTEENFLDCLQQRNHQGRVAEHKERVVGFMIVEYQKLKVSILKFVVHPSLRNQHVGSQLLDKLKRELSSCLRTSITLELPETSEIALRFFQQNDFEAREF